MPTASLVLPPVTEQVRTARLVAGTAARRAGVPEDLLDDVKLAVGEAMSVALRGVTADSAPSGGAPGPDITVDMTDDGARFLVEVRFPAAEDPSGADADDEVSLTLIAALAEVHAQPGSTSSERIIALSWELAAR
jgi:Histidine kinase-like ATPase domain